MAIPIRVTSIHCNNQQMALLLWYHGQRHHQIITQTIPVRVQVVCHVITTAMAMVDIIRVLIKITTTTASHAILATTNKLQIKRQLLKEILAFLEYTWIQFLMMKQNIINFLLFSNFIITIHTKTTITHHHNHHHHQLINSSSTSSHFSGTLIKNK